jgi:hypothetical protein
MVSEAKIIFELPVGSGFLLSTYRNQFWLELYRGNCRKILNFYIWLCYRDTLRTLCVKKNFPLLQQLAQHEFFGVTGKERFFFLKFGL